MTITMGQLISSLFDEYERRYHDRELAAVATQVALVDVLAGAGKRRRAPRRG
jgi:hypothetical protein